MPSRDANNTTWYVLRYQEDFVARGSSPVTDRSPFAAASSPYLSPELLFDNSRGVLELQYLPSADPVEPPLGAALGPDGVLFRVDDRGILEVVACDGSKRPFFCEPYILAQPAGLALDRRRYLYIADPAAGRVVVAESWSSHVVAILIGDERVGYLEEPVDVIVNDSGMIFVADRGKGKVTAFSAGMKPLFSFDLPHATEQRPTPIALFLDPEGYLICVDSWMPRATRFSAVGELQSQVDLESFRSDSQVAPNINQSLDFRCHPCSNTDDSTGLIAWHRWYRVGSLRLDRRFAHSGFFTSRRLDSGRPNTAWHRVEVELQGPLPQGCSVQVETHISDRPTPDNISWDAPRTAQGELISYSSIQPTQLISDRRGRYLWVRVTINSADGQFTPSIGSITVWYPRVSWLDLLPSIYRRDPDAAGFLGHFLALFEHVFTSIENSYDEFSRQLNPGAAPAEVIDWLASLIDLAFDPSWPLDRRRALVSEAISLYRMRGTVAGLIRYIEIYAGSRPEIVEGWLERPSRPAFLGRRGSILGCGIPLLGPSSSMNILPDCDLWNQFAHRFTVLVYLHDDCDSDVMLAVVDKIISENKPAHTSHRLQAVYPTASVGAQSRVGFDFVLGDRVTSATLLQEIGTAPLPSGVDGRTGILGIDTVLSDRIR